MKPKSVTLILANFNYDLPGRSFMGMLLCAEGLRNLVELPEPEPETIYAVFTQRARADSFKLLANSLHRGSSIAEYKGYMMSAARKLCKRMYAKGFRYVHIEY